MNHLLDQAKAHQASLRAEAAQRRQNADATIRHEHSGSIIAIIRQAIRSLGTESGSVVPAAN